MATEVWVATAAIWLGNVRAYNINNIVPDSVVAQFGLEAAGLVELRTASDTGVPSHGVDPATQTELDSAVATRAAVSEVFAGDGKFRVDKLPASVPRTVNGKAPAANGDVVLSAGDVGALPASTTAASLGALDQTAGDARYPRKGDLVFNVKDYGAKGDGTADDTAAINATIAAMPSLANTFGGVSGVLYFPAGRYLTDGGHTIPADKRMTIRGAGPYVSIIQKRSGTADLLTLNAGNTGISGLTLDGNRGTALGGDLLVLNAGYTYARNCTIANAYGNGITVGKASGAIAHRLNDLNIRTCRNYGIQVIAASESTDGQWTNIDIGQCGLSGVRISTGAQQLVNVHAWGNGLESTTDKHGIWLNSSSNHLTNCESETNLGSGFLISSAGSDNNTITGSFAWGNVASGLYGLRANRTVLTGNSFYNNGVTNTAGATSPSFAGIQNESCVEWVLVGNTAWDNGTSVPAGSYAVAPTYPYPGRIATATQSYGYAETNTGSGVPDNNVISGNVFRKERTRSGVAVINLGPSNQWSCNNLGSASSPTVASAATVTLPAQSDFVEITGTVVITSIVASYPSRRVTLRFSDAAPGQVTDGGNLRLAGNFVPTTDDTLTLACDGTNWYETARSVN